MTYWYCNTEEVRCNRLNSPLCHVACSIRWFRETFTLPYCATPIHQGVIHSLLKRNRRRVTHSLVKCYYLRLDISTIVNTTGVDDGTLVRCELQRY